MESDIEQVEISIEQARKLIDERDRARALTDNPDFKKLVLEGYFKDESVRLVLLKAEPGMQTKEHQEAILKSMDGIGMLQQYFRNIMQQGAMAERSLIDDQATLSELMAEDLN